MLLFSSTCNHSSTVGSGTGEGGGGCRIIGIGVGGHGWNRNSSGGMQSCVLHRNLSLPLVTFSKCNCMTEPNIILVVYTGEWPLRIQI